MSSVLIDPGQTANTAKDEIANIPGVSLETMDRAQVMLVGSANMDLVVRTHHFPLPGETLQGIGFQTFPGGKGANQATAIGRLGGRVGLVAKVGADPFGDQLIDSLQLSGVDTSSVLQDSAAPTGVALITVDDSGQNMIVVAPGANSLLTPKEVDQSLSGAQFSVLLAQLEVPLESVIYAASFAEGRVFILNPAPAREVPNELLCRVDYLTPNETEARFLTGILPSDDATCLACAEVLLSRGVRNVLFTLGPRGSFLANETGGRHFPTIDVATVDTTGAGDAFNGAFAHFLASGEAIERAITLANIVGALSTTKNGAQASMPTLEEVLSRAL